jgi:hypothetical protein
MTSRALALLVAVMVLASCSSVPANYVVLLDNPAGRPSAVQLTTAGGTGVIDRPGQAIGTDDPRHAPGAPFTPSERRIEATFGPAMAAHPELPVHFIVNFEFESTDLTEESRRRLPEILKEIQRSCRQLGQQRVQL